MKFQTVGMKMLKIRDIMSKCKENLRNSDIQDQIQVAEIYVRLFLYTDCELRGVCVQKDFQPYIV